MQLRCIQRRCGERTQDAYLASLPFGDRLHVVTGTDAFTASSSSLRLATTFSADWWLFVDADVRLYEDSLTIITASAIEVPPNVYQIRFALDDKITDAPLFGVHLHRGCFVDKAYAWFQSHGVPGLRGESRNIKAFMREEGLHTRTSSWVVGSHDYGQFYRDLALKYYIRGHRFRKNVSQLRECLLGREKDADVSVALRAIDASVIASPPTSDGRHAWNPDAILTELKLTEKSLPTGPCETDDIQLFCHPLPPTQP